MLDEDLFKLSIEMSIKLNEVDENSLKLLSECSICHSINDLSIEIHSQKCLLNKSYFHDLMYILYYYSEHNLELRINDNSKYSIFPVLLI